MSYESKDLEGALFSKNEAVVLGKGKIPINGENEYCCLIQSKLPDGTEIIEMMVSAGRIYKNENTNPKAPDLGNKSITIRGQDYQFAGWINTAQNGSDYVAVKLTKNEEAPF